MPILDSPDFGHTFVPIDSLTSSPRSSTVGSTSVLEWNSDSSSECFSARSLDHEQHSHNSPPVPHIPSQVSPNTPSSKEFLSGHSQKFASSKSAAPKVDGMSNDINSGTSVDEYRNLLGALEGKLTLQDSDAQWSCHSYRNFVGLHRPETPPVVERSGNVVHDEQHNGAAPSPDRSVTTDSSISAVTATQPLHASSLFLPPAPITSHVYPASSSVVPNHNNSENISIAQYFQLKGATEEAEPVQPPADGPPRPMSAASCLSYASSAESPIQTPAAVPLPDCGMEPPILQEPWHDFISRISKESVSTATGCTKRLPRSHPTYWGKTNSAGFNWRSTLSKESLTEANNIGSQCKLSKVTPPSSQTTDTQGRNLKSRAPPTARRRALPSISCEDTPPLKPINPTLPNITSLPSIQSRHPPYMASSYDSFYGKIPKLTNGPVPPSSLQSPSSAYPTFNCQIPPPPTLPLKPSYNGTETRDIGQASPESADSRVPPAPMSWYNRSVSDSKESRVPLPATWYRPAVSVSGSQTQFRPTSDANGKSQGVNPWGSVNSWGGVVGWASPIPSGSPISASAIPPSPSQVDLQSAYFHHTTAVGGSKNSPPSKVPFVSRTPSPTPAFDGAYSSTQRPPRALPNPSITNSFGTYPQFPFTPRYTGSTLPRDTLRAGPPTWGPTPRRLRFAPLPPTPAGVPYTGIPNSTLPYTTPLPSYPSYPMSYPYQPYQPPAPQLPIPVSPPYSPWQPETTTDSQHWTPHPVFSYSDGSIVFRIGNIGYNVHRHFFERHSTYFRDLLAHPKYAATSPLPHVVHLFDVKKVDFERLLLIFYPSNLVDSELFSVEDWTSILMLSNKWNFAQLKTLAVRELGYITTTLEKIALSKEYNVGNPQWLLAAYRELCTRYYPLSLLEAEKLGLETVIKIWEVQHELNTWGPPPVDTLIRNKFGLY